MYRKYIYATFALLPLISGVVLSVAPASAEAQIRTYICTASTQKLGSIGPISITANTGAEAYQKFLDYLRATYPNDDDISGGIDSQLTMDCK